MTIKANILEIQALQKKSGLKVNTDKINNTIDLYRQRKIPNFRTARHLVEELSFPTSYNKKRA